MSKMGRPTTYKPEYCEDIIEYFSIEPYYEKEIQIVTKTGDVATIQKEVANDLPTFAGWCAKNATHREVMHQWRKKYEDFNNAYKRAKELQEQFLVINMTKGLFVPSAAIFTAKNILNYRDNKGPEVVVKNNNITQNNTLNLKLEKYQKMTREELEIEVKKRMERIK